MAKKTIELSMTTYNLGQTGEDEAASEAYRAAVEKRLEETYPDADVTVTLEGFDRAGASDTAEAHGFGDDIGTRETVLGIAQDVFSDGDW